MKSTYNSHLLNFLEQQHTDINVLLAERQYGLTQRQRFVSACPNDLGCKCSFFLMHGAGAFCVRWICTYAFEEKAHTFRIDNFSHCS